MRPALCEEALRLGRYGWPHARRTGGPGPGRTDGDPGVATRARIGPCGEPILLLEQNRAPMGSAADPPRPGCARSSPEAGRTRRALCTAGGDCRLSSQAVTAADTDWGRIAALYAELARLAASPVVEFNRAVGRRHGIGSAAGLEIVEALASEPSLQPLPPLPSVRGDFLQETGPSRRSRVEFERAASLTRNARERELLLERAGACADAWHRAGWNESSGPWAGSFALDFNLPQVQRFQVRNSPRRPRP